MKNGFIKLHRQIQDHWLWNNDEPFDRRSAWIDLIMMASWKSGTRDFKGQIIEQRRGDVVTSVKSLSMRWRWSEGKVRRYLDALQKDGMLTKKRQSHGVVLTIENFSSFQDERRTDSSSHGSSRGSSDGDNRRMDKEEDKETRARECDQEAVDSAQREDDEELARLLGYESVEELERRRA